jgi:acetyl-CoA acetyltransferase
MHEAVIVSAVRLPTGKFLGTLKDFQAPELGALVVREAVRRAGIDPASVDECIMLYQPAPARRRLGKPPSEAAWPITSPRSRSTRCAARD